MRDAIKILEQRARLNPALQVEYDKEKALMEIEMNFLTVKEVAKRLKMCPHAVREAIRKGKINAIRPGIGIRSPYKIPEAELERIMLMCMCR